jgi:hypothetical protein
MNKEKYFSKDFVQQMMLNYSSEPIVVQNVKLFDIDNSASILVTLTSASSTEFIGHFGIEVEYLQDQKLHTKKMVMKVKPHGKAISDMLAGLSTYCNPTLEKAYHEIKDLTGFWNTHDKEILVYTEKNAPIFPIIYGYYLNEQENIYALLMEFFDEVELLNSVMDVNAWDKTRIRIGVDALIQWHQVNVGHTEWYTNKYKDFRDAEQIMRLQICWLELLNNASERFPELYTERLQAQLKAGIHDILTLWIELDEIPKSVVHNDFNPRNSFFKNTTQNEKTICVYDWELASIHFPVYDLIEFLSFTASTINDDELAELFKTFQQKISERSSIYANDTIYRASILCSAYDFGLHRLGMYMMAHSVGPYPFIPHVIRNYERILNYALQQS